VSSKNNPPAPANPDARHRAIAQAREQGVAPMALQPVAYVKIGNDDLAKPLNLRHDGGIVSSQISAGLTGGVLKGRLKGSSYTFETSATTFTGWSSADNRVEDPVRGKMVSDGYQAPKGERFNLTGAVIRPHALRDGSTLDLGARLDLGYVTGNTPVQDAWHRKWGADYYRTRINTVESTALVNAEVTAARHTLHTLGKLNADHSLFGGVAVGNGYQGVMAGSAFSIGSPSGKYFPQTVHSAQFGNTDTQRWVAGGSPAPGAWLVDAYAKATLSGNSDYRTNMAGDNPLQRPHDRTYYTEGADRGAYRSGKFGDTYLGEAYRLEGGQRVALPQYNPVFTKEHVPYRLETMIAKYEFSPVNFQAGISGHYQVSPRVGVHASVAAHSNPVKATVGAGYAASHAAESERLRNTILWGQLKDVTGDFGVVQVTPGLTRLYEYVPSIGTPVLQDKQSLPWVEPEEITSRPPVNFTGNVGVTVRLGKNR